MLGLWRRAFIIAGVTLGSVVLIRGQVPTWQPADAAGQGQTPIMPVQQEPHHRQLFQYGPMRILDLQIPPGDTSWFHSHEWPVFYLTLADSPTRTQNLGEDWGAGRGRGARPGGAGDAAGRGTPPPSAAPAAAPATPGTPPAAPFRRPRLMSDLSYADKPVTHRIQNVGTGLFRAMVIVNETQGGDEAITETAAGFAGKAEFSNRWFRAYRVALGPGEKTPSHRHNAPVVILQDTAGQGTGAGAMKFEFNDPGQWAFFDAGDTHVITNTGDSRVDFLEVEVRRK